MTGNTKKEHHLFNKQDIYLCFLKISHFSLKKKKKKNFGVNRERVKPHYPDSTNLELMHTF